MLNLLFYEFERPVPGGFSDCFLKILLYYKPKGGVHFRKSFFNVLIGRRALALAQYKSEED